MSVETSGRYRLLHRLGAGGMGVVYRAEALGAEGFAKPVVIKQLRRNLSGDLAAQRRLVYEAKALMRLNHRNIVQVLDLGQLEDGYFIAMEYVHGADLRRVMARAKNLGVAIPRAVALHIAVETLRGLDFVHRSKDAEGRLVGLVHRDVTPANILVSNEGEVRLTDFGLARMSTAPSKLTGVMLVGTAHYMSPEQAAGETIDARADLYSLGCVLYQLLCGRTAFAGDDLTEALDAVMSGRVDVEPLQQLPAPVAAIVERALERDPARRYSSAAAMLSDLEAYERATERASSSDLRHLMQRLFEDESEEFFGPPSEALADALLELDVDRPQSAELSLYRKLGESWLAEDQHAAPEARTAVTSQDRPRAKAVLSDTPGSSAAAAVERRPRAVLVAVLLSALLAVAALGAYFGLADNGHRAPAADGRAPYPASPRDLAAPDRTARDAAPPADKHNVVFFTPPPRKPPKRPPIKRPKRAGILRITTMPAYAEVLIRGRKRCDTPCRLTLPVGKHRVVLRSPGSGRKVTRSARVAAGRESALVVKGFR